ncbi:MAG TPA: hypothetical protein VG603_09875, partial [Chitinophagales bacterium]|nr:hypothetical protein [Chitinophagales bacterium]
RVTVLAPVARAGHDNVIRQLMDYNVLVQVYTDKGDKAVKTYYVGGPTPDNEGTYMVLENNGKLSERPYITYIPGMHGYLSPRFNMKEEDWRSKLLFDYREGDIKSLSVEYPGDEKKSFTITSIAPDSFELQPKENKYTIKEPYRQQYIREYLRFYSGIYFEAFDNNLPTKDSVMHTTPYCVFTITGKDNSVNKASLFYMPISQRSKMQFDTKGNEMTYDVDHYYAAVNNNQDFTVVQYYVFGKLLREYKDFFFKPAANKH